MERIRKQERLPEGMALVETAEGKWFPAFALFSEIPLLVYVVEGSPLIPLTLDSFHERAQGYDCREEAIEACHALREAVELTQEWRGLAARTELYSERNAWYLDEIARLAGGDNSPHLHCRSSMQVVVLVRGNGRIEVITATGDIPDEAIEILYQRVYEWSRRPQVLACASPIHSR